MEISKRKMISTDSIYLMRDSALKVPDTDYTRAFQTLKTFLSKLCFCNLWAGLKKIYRTDQAEILTN